METLDVIENPIIKNKSYLYARDPSILTWGRTRLVPENLTPQLTEETEQELQEYSSEDDDQLQVYLRIKKENINSLYEIVDDKSLCCNVPEDAHCSRNIRDGSAVTKIFKFSKIFGSTSTQSEVFNNVVKEKVLRFINGLNSSLLTYGASGSGKTFTIIGTPEHPGIIPRALEYMFRTLPSLPEHPQYKPGTSGGIKKLSQTEGKMARSKCSHLINVVIPSSERIQQARIYKDMQERLSREPVGLIMEDIGHVNLSIWVSFAEIYNEYVYDLLTSEESHASQRQKLRIGNCHGSAYIKDLTYVNVKTGLEAYHILQFGLNKLKYASTNLNDHSSRSHSIFTIKLCQSSDTKEGISISSFSFCDLAGSERIKKTNHVGDRLKESNNINRSLLILGRCINLVRESQKDNKNIPIPFRESKLTQLFQRALQGLESISMIVNINPIRSMFDESQHVLTFSAIAKDIIIEKQVSVQVKTKKQSFVPILEKLDDTEKQELLQQIESLCDEIEQQKHDHEEENENLKIAYQKMIQNTKESYEKRFKQMQETLNKRIQDKETYIEQITKKRKIETINLDSSDEEDLPEENDKNLDLVNLKCTLELKENDLIQYKENNKLLEKQLKLLETENFKLQDKVAELEDYIQAIQQSRNDMEE